jgi:hypothetical protein
MQPAGAFGVPGAGVVERAVGVRDDGEHGL